MGVRNPKNRAILTCMRLNFLSVGFCLALVLGSLPVATPHAAELRFAQVQTIGWPLLKLRQSDGLSTADSGLLMDLGQAIAKELGMVPVFSAVPRKRVEEMLIAGREHVVCYADPKWLEHSDQYQWSRVFLSNNNLLVTPIGTTPLKNLKEIAPGRAGTVFGYVYPELQLLFDNGTLQREDAPHDESNFKKFLAGRMSYMVTNQLFLDDALRQQPDAKGKISSIMKIREIETRCALSKLAPVTLEQFDAAMDRLKQRGVFAKIISNYR